MIRRPLGIIIILLFSFNIFAQNTVTFPRIESDPRADDFFRRGLDGFSWTDLAEMSLWSSDADLSTAANAALMQQINRMADDIRTYPDLPSENRERAEFILEYMHRNLLRTYSFPQTRVDTMLSTGRYNCVSSAVLYVILCKSIGIRASGVITRDHAFAMVHINGEDIDVETTNRFGFDPGRRRDFHDDFGRLTGFSYVPQGSYRDRQTISEIELVSLILRNRIAELEGRGRFAEAVPLAVDRTALLRGGAGTVSLAGLAGSPSTEFFEDPYKNLIDRLLNYGASLAMARNFTAALTWAQNASAIYPDEERWNDFIMNCIDADLANRTNGIRTVSEGELLISAIEEARSLGNLREERANEFLTSSIQRIASLLSGTQSGTRDWLAGINYIEDAILRFGSNRDLEQTLSAYRTNRATDFHNRFAAAWNRRNYDEAERILNEGLAEFPDDRRLLANMDTVIRHRR
ncbi:MAG: hypothetical protein FWG77_02365 [Treponema sp.]|nr:hypothetical protein [Treponema sp.]